MPARRAAARIAAWTDRLARKRLAVPASGKEQRAFANTLLPWSASETRRPQPYKSSASGRCCAPGGDSKSARSSSREDLRLAVLHVHSAQALHHVASVERHVEQEGQCGERTITTVAAPFAAVSVAVSEQKGWSDLRANCEPCATETALDRHLADSDRTCSSATSGAS